MRHIAAVLYNIEIEPSSKAKKLLLDKYMKSAKYRPRLTWYLGLCYGGETLGLNRETVTWLQEAYEGPDHASSAPLRRIDWRDLRRLTKKLNKRQLTGHAARDAILELIKGKHANEVKWTLRLIERKPRIGLESKYFDKVVGKKIHKDLPVGLAKKIAKKHDLKEGEWIAEPKIDGIRAIGLYNTDDKVWRFYTRNGKERKNTEIISSELISQGFPVDQVLDGELWAGSWNDTSKISNPKTEKYDHRKAELKIIAFDMISLKDWESKTNTEALRDRRVNLAKGLGVSIKVDHLTVGMFDTACRHIKVTRGYQTINPKAAWGQADLYAEYGYEGAVIKDLDSVYPFKRTDNWLKLKFEETHDGVITGFEEGAERSKHKGRLGKFLVQYKGEAIKVGGSYKDSMTDSKRQEFWDNRDELIGKTIEFIVQKDPDGGIEVIARFARLVRIRDDK